MSSKHNLRMLNRHVLEIEERGESLEKEVKEEIDEEKSFILKKLRQNS